MYLGDEITLYTISLVMYENTRADLKTLLAEGEKYPPKHGGRKKNSLKRKCQCFGVNGRGRVTTLRLRK